MVAQQRGSGRANALKGELRAQVNEASAAPAEAVYEVLADIRSHLEWAGAMQAKKKVRLTSIEAPEGPATVGTEFSSTGVDPMGRFADTSVVTEASQPTLFEFVTEARLTTKKSKVIEWTNVHRYEIEPRADGCVVSYTFRIVRLSELPGALAMFRVPGLRALGLKLWGSTARRGLRNLVEFAGSRAAERGKEGSSEGPARLPGRVGS